MARTWSEVEAAGRHVGALTTRSWVRRLARVGYAARGVVYAVIGVLAARVALGEGGRTTDTRGALESVARAPFGEAILVALGAGFAALALWYAVVALVDPSAGARQPRERLLHRVGKAVAAFAYAGLALAAFRLVTGGSAGASGGAQAEGLTARALGLPGGRLLVLAAAGAVLFAAGRRVHKGVKRKFLAHLETSRMTPRGRAWAARLGTAGLVSQGLLFGIVGALLGWAAATYEPSRATGLDGALRALARQPAGAVLLGLVAAGLLAYAAYSFVEARHRRLAA